MNRRRHLRQRIDFAVRVRGDDALLLQEIGGVAFSLNDDGGQNVCAGYVVTASPFGLDRDLLDDPLEPRGWFCVAAFSGDE